MHRVDISDIFVVRQSFGTSATGDKRSVMLIEFKMLFEEACKSGSLLLPSDKIVENSNLMSIILNTLIFIFSAQGFEILTRFKCK